MILVRAFYNAIFYLPTFVLYFHRNELVTVAFAQDIRNISNHLLMSKTVFMHLIVLQVVCYLCVLAPHHLPPGCHHAQLADVHFHDRALGYDTQTGKTKTCLVTVRRLKVIAPRRWLFTVSVVVYIYCRVGRMKSNVPT